MNDRHARLDELKRLMGVAVLNEATISVIRQRSLHNLDRWKAKGVWVSAHEEWRALMTSGTDADVREAMTGTGEAANRLRQSPPYVGLISEQTRYRLLQAVGFRPPSPHAEKVTADLLNDTDRLNN